METTFSHSLADSGVRLHAGAPDLAQRSALLSELLSNSLQSGEHCLQSVALKTAGFLPAELSALVADAAASAVSSSVIAADVNQYYGPLKQSRDSCRRGKAKLQAGRSCLRLGGRASRTCFQTQNGYCKTQNHN